MTGGRLEPRVRGLLNTEALYAGYLPRQEADIRTFRRDEMASLPTDIAYTAIGGLSTELCEKLARIQPKSLGAASRIQGMTPAALAALSAHVRGAQHDRARNAERPARFT